MRFRLMQVIFPSPQTTLCVCEFSLRLMYKFNHLLFISPDRTACLPVRSAGSWSGTLCLVSALLASFGFTDDSDKSLKFLQ